MSFEDMMGNTLILVTMIDIKLEKVLEKILRADTF